MKLSGVFLQDYKNEKKGGNKSINITQRKNKKVQERKSKTKH